MVGEKKFTGAVGLLFFCLVLIADFGQSADFFESLLVRLNCFGDTQPGCNKELVDIDTDEPTSVGGTTRANTYFYLFTCQNEEHPELLHKCGGHLPPGSKFNKKYPVVFVVPGFVSGVCNFALFREIKNVYLNRGCYNVILVDYMWGNSFDYLKAILNLPIVAKQIAKVIRILKETHGLTKKDFTCTGHSLGAHVCGFVGQETAIAVINALDAAGEHFTENTPLPERLDAGDADCVQVVHCNGGQCFPSRGVNFTCGTVDFWMNDGLKQYSCVKPLFEAFLKKDLIFGIINLIPDVCYHFQCVEYYKAALLPDCQFVGVKCNSSSDFESGKCNRSCGSDGENCAVMGVDSCHCLSAKQRNATGPQNYYIKTDFNCPYCDNKDIDLGGFQCKPNISKK